VGLLVGTLDAEVEHHRREVIFALPDCSEEDTNINKGLILFALLLGLGLCLDLSRLDLREIVGKPLRWGENV